MAMGSHQSTAMKTDNWLTPPEIISALGVFDTDPYVDGSKAKAKAGDAIGLLMPVRV